MSYVFRGMVVPDRTLESLQRYIDDGVPTGGFLEAVLDNDLAEACGRADEEHLQVLPAIVAYLYAVAPTHCWGFAGAHDRYVKHKFAERKRKAEVQ